MHIVKAVLIGILSSLLWTLWVLAIANHTPIRAGLIELAVLFVGSYSIQYVVDRRRLEWWLCTIAAAITTTVVVWLQI